MKPKQLTNQQYVWEQMLMMFGPQWVQRYGESNPVWSEALDNRPLADIKSAVTLIRNGRLDYWDINLPAFMQLVTPAFAPQPKQRRPWSDFDAWDAFANRLTLKYVIKASCAKVNPVAVEEEPNRTWKLAREIAALGRDMSDEPRALPEGDLNEFIQVCLQMLNNEFKTHITQAELAGTPR